MKYTKKLRQFIRFLKDNDVFKQYMFTTKNAKGQWFENRKFSDRYFEIFQECFEDIIDMSFCWAATKEGHEFWLNLHKKWKYDVSTKN